MAAMTMVNHLISRRVAAVLFSLVFGIASTESRGADIDAKEKDGIAADLAVIRDRAILRWRFLKPLTQVKIDTITAEIEGELLGIPTIKGFPFADEQSYVLALVDISGPQRKAGIIREAADVFLTAQNAPDYVNLAVATYAKNVRILQSGLQDIMQTLISTPPEDTEPDLKKALQIGILSFSSTLAERRGLFVFTDGHSPEDLGTDTLVADALKNGVSITFVLTDPNRAVDLASLRRLADGTGGQVIERKDNPLFLSDPYLLLNSGGVAVFPVPQSVRMPWEPDPVVRAAIRYGQNSLELAAPAPMSVASSREIADTLYQRHPVPVWIIAAAVIGLLLTLIAFIVTRTRYRRRTGVATAPLDNVTAVLQDVDRGTVYAILDDITEIGRDVTNQVVVEDSTVSRFHSQIIRDTSGTFTIVNKSAGNGTRLNEKTIDRSPLADGDLLAMGATTLRFKYRNIGDAVSG